MQKILFYIDTLRAGGAEKVLCNLVNNMDQSKFQITVQTTWPVDPGQYLAPGICYRSIYPRESRFYHQLYRLEAALGLVYSLHMKGDYDIEVAYLECGPTKILAGSTNKKAVKLAWVHCDLQKKMTDLATFQRKARGWYAKYDHVVCVSNNVRDSYVELFGELPEAVTLYNTVDDAEILEKAHQPLPELAKKRKFTVVTLGRLTHQKGYDQLLQIHKRLLDVGLDHDLWVLGEGPERPALEAYIRENTLGDSVKLFGFQSNPYPFLRDADLLVCSSRYEGFSTFVTEGLILGKPIVTTDCTGMRELLGDSQYGLITENTAEGLFLGMKTMLSDPGLRGRYQAQAQLRGQDFRTKELAAQTEEFLIQMTEERR